MSDTQRYNFEQGKLADWVKVFSRTSSVPLDRSQLFDSYEDALAYAQGDGSDYRKLGKTAWVGQPISVVENNVAKFYIISEKSTAVNGETVVERVLESVGSGVIVLENFTIQNGSIVEATADKVGSLIYLTTGTTTYPKGLYIVTGANKVAAFATPDNLKIVKKTTANSGASATYELQLNGITQGVTIDIPKDLVVSSGSVVTFKDSDKPFPTGVTTAGTYIKLTLANSGGDLYINVNSLVDVYTTGDNYIKVENYQISLNWSNVVSALIVDTNFTKFISDTLASFKTTLLSEIANTYANIGSVQNIQKYKFEIKSDTTFVNFNEVTETEFLHLKIVKPFSRDGVVITQFRIETSDGTRIQSYESDDEAWDYKIAISELKNLFTEGELILQCSFAASLFKNDLNLCTEFLHLYTLDTVYYAQLLPAEFVPGIGQDSLVNLTTLATVDVLHDKINPSFKVNQLRRNIQIQEDVSGEPTILVFAVPAEVKNIEIRSIAVTSNGFKFPVDSSILEGVLDITLNGRDYHLFKAPIEFPSYDLIENVNIELYNSIN